jgi:hypothetical protein
MTITIDPMARGRGGGHDEVTRSRGHSGESLPVACSGAQTTDTGVAELDVWAANGTEAIPAGPPREVRRRKADQTDFEGKLSFSTRPNREGKTFILFQILNSLQIHLNSNEI